jgi:hypothetical protein
MIVLYETTLVAGKGTVPCRVFRQGSEYGVALWDRARNMPLGKGKTLGEYAAKRLADALLNAKSEAMKAALVWATMGYDALRYRNEIALANTECHPGKGNKVV